VSDEKQWPAWTLSTKPTEPFSERLFRKFFRRIKTDAAVQAARRRVATDWHLEQGFDGWYVIGPRVLGNEQGRYGPYTEEGAGQVLAAFRESPDATP
jgi:hypothetical protein